MTHTRILYVDRNMRGVCELRQVLFLFFYQSIRRRVLKQNKTKWSVIIDGDLMVVMMRMHVVVDESSRWGEE